jgi:hypothetical protein
MKINKNNYEIYFLDHFDGNLSVEDERELVLFLNNNPKLKEEFDGFANIQLDDEETVFKNKSSLLKKEIVGFASINENNFEEYFIGYFEGDLLKDEKIEVEKFVALNPSLKEEFNTHKKIFLPKEKVVFANKSSLKKKTVIIPFQFKSMMATAASIVLLISVFWLLRDQQVESTRVYISLNKTQSKNISFENKMNIKIAERKLEDNNLISKYSESHISDQNKELPNSRDNSVSINFISRHGNDIAITGEIDCAKLVKHENSFEYYYASANIQKESSLLGKIVNNNTNKITQSISPRKNKKSNTKRNDPFLVKFLQGSVAVFNTITGSDVEEIKVYDGQGNLKNYQMETQMLSMNKSYPVSGVE